MNNRIPSRASRNGGGRSAGQHQDPERARPAPLPGGRQAQKAAEDEGHAKPEDGQLHRGREEVGQVRRHRPAGPQGHFQVAVHQPAT